MLNVGTSVQDVAGIKIAPVCMCSSAVSDNTDVAHSKALSVAGTDVGDRIAGRACTQCHAQQTPVWRAGPHGPKTLCNACGVRWMKHSKRSTRHYVPKSRYAGV